MTSELMAKKRNFSDPYSGLLMGAGYYKAATSSANRFEPIYDLAETNRPIDDIRKTSNFAYRIGPYFSTPEANFELFFRYMRNVRRWESAGGATSGIGKTTIKGFGGGTLISFRVLGEDRFRLMLGAMAEMLTHNAHIVYYPDTKGSEVLNLQSKNFLIGPLLQTEIYLGDLWSVSFLTAYEYGLSRNWNVKEASRLFEIERQQGETVSLKNPGKAVVSEFGGFLLEATLKLSFY
jgi:hypothetical protein